MTTPSSMNDRDRLVHALRGAWEAEAARVAQFGLELVEDRIQPVGSGWSVPVSSGVPTGSAYELARTLDRLQERVEEESQLSISLFLDPVPTTAGR